MSLRKEDTVVYGVRVPKTFSPIFKKMLADRCYVNVSDYLRDLIRKDYEKYCLELQDHEYRELLSKGK